MESFLLKVVKKILSDKTELSELVFVLPNQRAGVHLKKYLKEEINKTSFFPELLTFDSFAQQIADLPKISSVELLFEFYQIYLQETPKEKIESFDLFANWATTILNDFNEVDAYLIDPKSIFDSLKNINQLHNWNPNTELTKNYLSFFQNLDKYYYAYYDQLILAKKAYQGMIFKEAVANLTTFLSHTKKHFIFVGFNQLKTSESHIIQELLEAERASIYWDISTDLLQSNHVAGTFIRSYKDSWNYYSENKMSWITQTQLNPNNIEIIGIPKNVGMIKYAGELLKKSVKSLDTALILADQNLLASTLNSLPKNIDKVNITMGLPLKNFPFSDLVKALFELHIQAKKNGEFYYKNILKIIQHPIIRTHFKNMDDFIIEFLNNNKVYYNFDALEKLVEKTLSNREKLLILFKRTQTITEVLSRVNGLIIYLQQQIKGSDKEVLFKHFQLNQQLLHLNNTYPYFKKETNTKTALKTFYKIYKSLLFTENLNFIGEPLEGLQIMGFLETQALNFDRVLITSLNEGILPKSNSNPSFIPFDVRKHYGLPTYKEENANLSYHFFRLLGATKKVSLLYNNQTDGFGGGEKSQFLTQLIWKYPSIKQRIINPLVVSNPVLVQSMDKTPAISEKLKNIASKGFSPSALASYLYNPIAFYQQRILGVYENTGIEETVADKVMGTVIHNVLEKLYQPFVGKLLSDAKLAALIPKIRQEVKDCFLKEYPNGQIDEGKNKLIFEVVIQFIQGFINDEIRSIKEGHCIRVIALEKYLEAEINFPNINFPVKIKGFVDRIDEVDGVIKIMDYKSGKVTSTQLNASDLSKLAKDYKYSKSLQVLLYAYLYSQDAQFNSSKELQAGILSFKNLQAGYMPVNFGTARKKDFKITPLRLDEFLIALEQLIVEIFDTTIPFEVE